MLATGALFATWVVLMSAGVGGIGVYVGSEYPSAILASLRRFELLQRPVDWWKARSTSINIDTLLVSGPIGSVAAVAPVLPNLPADSAAWEELLAESIHLLKMNRDGKLSAQPQMMWYPTQGAAKLVSVAARDPSRHKALLTSGVVDALLYTTGHDFRNVGSGLAEYTAGASVSLIGRNEGGLTLPKEAVDAVLGPFHNFFSSARSTDWRVQRDLKTSVTKMVGKALPIVCLVIADANKSFVLEHATVLDDLIQGLLLDESNPRRGQNGAAKLQETCALVLQNLALSDVGKGPLRSHSGVMPALRSVASGSAGLSDRARRYAEGALFELDEAVRQKTKEEAAAHSALMVEHVMLSYNWGHQDVIKRINSALQARKYAVWIDVEKMQGSTVEAMAEAVEQAACVVYGISQAYKESTNCRMEAQYAWQQKKDMVPLMLEEQYRPTGWLGMMLGVRLWYGFYGSALTSAEAFEGKVEELCRELGDRGLS
jgi:hypothetical protein